MDAETQKKAVLNLLRAKPMSTFDFRNVGICHPAARVQELRKAGHRIDTEFSLIPRPIIAETCMDRLLSTP